MNDTAEISNTTLSILVFAALAVVVAGSLFTFGGGSITGFASSGDGNVTLTINQSLNIQVNTSKNVIAYGYCTPRGGSSYYCASNDSVACDNVTLSLGNCTGDTATPQYINVYNVGNVNASVNVSTTCTASQLIGGTSPAFNYVTTNCDGGTGSSIDTWTPFASTGTLACNRTAVGTSGFKLYTNVTIPQNAQPGGCSNNAAILTFSAIITT